MLPRRLQIGSFTRTAGGLVNDPGLVDRRAEPLERRCEHSTVDRPRQALGEEGSPRPEDLYRRINENGTGRISAVCPKCEHPFEVEEETLGG